MTPDEIREARARLGLSQAGLAAALGVTPWTVAAWERPEGHPSRRESPPMLRLAIEALELRRAS